MKYIRTTIAVKPEHHKRLLQLAEDNEISMMAYMRFVISQHLADLDAGAPTMHHRIMRTSSEMQRASA